MTEDGFPSAGRPHSALGNLAPEDFARASAAAMTPAVNEQTLVVLD
jgi:hypothetical protein